MHEGEESIIISGMIELSGSGNGVLMGVRVSPVEELVGLDLSQHSEAGYRL